VIELTISLENAEAVRASLSAVSAKVIPTMMRTARRAIWRGPVPKTIQRVARDSGIGSAIWGRDQSGLEKQGLVKQGRLVLGTTEGETSLVLRGIPALLEDGGKIKEHTIRNGFGRKGKRMRHPGMQLRPHGFGKSSLDQGMAQLQADVDAAITEMVRRNG
jgi:hypothetical protein